jgi:hypothetical protein
MNADKIQEFRHAMHGFGIDFKDDIRADGTLQRFTPDGEGRGSKSGWYVLFSGPILAGAFGCWKRGVSEKWNENAYDDLDTDAREDVRRKIDDATWAHYRAEKHHQTLIKWLRSWKEPGMNRKTNKKETTRLLSEQLLLKLEPQWDAGGQYLLFNDGRYATSAKKLEKRSKRVQENTSIFLSWDHEFSAGRSCELADVVATGGVDNAECASVDLFHEYPQPGS